MATTRRLFLLRHAKSSWDAPDLADRDRPLAPRGRRAAIALAEHLRGLAAPPELVVCSSAARTVETLQLIRSGLPAGVAVTIDAALYGAEAEELLDRVRQLPPTVGAALLIGHNPGIGDLAVLLAGHGDPARRAAMAATFPTAALAELVLTQPWSRFAPRAATLAGYWTPR